MMMKEAIYNGKSIDDLQILGKYKSITEKLLGIQLPNLSKEEIDEAVNYSIKNNLHNPKAEIYNNYKEKRISMTTIDLCEYILAREPIMCASGVLFKKHADAPNPFINLISTFLDNRSAYKDKMFTFPKGSEDFEKYNLLQLLCKIDSNGLYGAFGNANCIFYNLHVAPSITTQARSCISSAGLQFEMFLANGVKFVSFDEMMTFINNIISEKPERKYKEVDLGIRNISVEECFAKVIMGCGFNYIPTEKHMQLVWDLLNRLDQEDINRIYYKNNLYEFMANKSMQRAVLYILSKLDKPFMNPNKPPKAIVTELDELKNIMMEFVYYHHQILDRLDKYNFMVRNICCITDTDSSIISVDAWYRYILQLIERDGMDIPIMHKKMDVVKYVEFDEFGDAITPVCKPVEDTYDFDFYNDELIENKRLIDPLTKIPEDGLRYSIVNIIAYILGKVVNDYMVRYTMNTNSYKEGKECLIFMKNEFLFKRLLLTDVKKNYASIQELQEGNVIKGGMLDVKGLQLTKSGTSERTQKRLKKILYEDILNTGDEFDFVKILKDLAVFEKQIINTIKSGSKEYFKPKKLKNTDTYVDPMSTSGVKEILIWNAVRDDGLEAFDLHDQNYFDIVKVNITPDNIEDIKDDYPETYRKFKELMKQDVFSSLIKGVAIPRDVDTPKWIMEYIDYTTIVNDNLHLFPLDQLKIYRGNSSSNNYTNIISL